MPIRSSGGVFDEQVLTGSLAHYVVCGADFSGAINSFGQPVPYSAAEIIFTKISEGAYINIMNPNECNLSFALEADRSIWDEISLTAMIQSLGPDVGSDHVDCSVCTVKRVPYIWGCDPGGATTFLELTDTPDTYAGAAGYVVTVNPGETGLIFTPATASNAFAFVASPSQPTLTAVGSDTLTIVGGTNVTISTNPGTNTLTINSSAASNDYIPVPGGTTLNFSTKYLVTSAGIVTLPPITNVSQIGYSVTIAKPISLASFFINVGQITDQINTDLGSTDSIEVDATEDLVFVVGSLNNWELQVGSIN